MTGGATRRSRLTVWLVLAHLTLSSVSGEAAAVNSLTPTDPGPAAAVGLRDGGVRRSRSSGGSAERGSGLDSSGSSDSGSEGGDDVTLTPRIASEAVTLTEVRDAQIASAEVTNHVTSEEPRDVIQLSPEVASSPTAGVISKLTRGQPTDVENRLVGVPDSLRHVFIAVKTSGQFHGSRLPPILDTWFTQTPNQVRYKKIGKISSRSIYKQAVHTYLLGNALHFVVSGV